MGDGGWGKGRRDCRTLLYALSGLDSILASGLLLSRADGAITVASLTPRLCPYPLDAADESVLVLVRSNTPEEFEYPDDAVDAFEGCLFAL